MEEERLSEEGSGQVIGTTGRGIGPCYQDKVGRVGGVRVAELLCHGRLRDRLRLIVERKNCLLGALSASAKTFNADALSDQYAGYGERMRPFITDTVRLLRRGREYGTVTGRPRRCGWFDAVATRYTVALASADALAVMLLDVLSELDELQICTAYELDGQRIDDFPSDAFILERCRPVYETLPGWRGDLSQARKLADLPAAARRYVERLGELLGLPVTIVSVGPDRE